MCRGQHSDSGIHRIGHRCCKSGVCVPERADRDRICPRDQKHDPGLITLSTGLDKFPHMTYCPIRDCIRKIGPPSDHKIAALDFEQLLASIRLRETKVESAAAETHLPFDAESTPEWSEHSMLQVLRHQAIRQLGIDADPSALMPDQHQCRICSPGPGVRRNMNQQFCSKCQ